MPITTENIRANIAKGIFKPHIYLTNLCLSYFQDARGYVSGKVFPIVPVSLPDSYFYEFDKGDLARDNVRRKPEYGHVSPAVYGKRDRFYHCEVDQVITGLDQISALALRRSGAPGVIDPVRAKVRFITEQLKIHLDRVWAGKYFNAASWTNVYQGGSSESGNTFYCFDNANCDPVSLFNRISQKMLVSGLRRPNKMVLGVHAFAALQTNPSILERIKYQGSEQNPADVTERVLAALFKMDEVIVAEAAYNAAEYGAADDLKFICDPDSVLLVHTTDAPSIDEPSAGYTFAWDMLGNGQWLAIQQFQGPRADHTEFIEGLVCTDPEIVAPDLGVFLKNAVSSGFAI